MKALSRVAGTLLLCAMLSCDNGASEPSGPGKISVQLSGTSLPTNALVLSVTGGPITSISGTGGNSASQFSTSSTNTRILVIGAINDGLLMELNVPDVSQDYTVTVLDAAGGQSTGYRANVTSSYYVTVER